MITVFDYRALDAHSQSTLFPVVSTTARAAEEGSSLDVLGAEVERHPLGRGPEGPRSIEFDD